jgi:hypothetical protein
MTKFQKYNLLCTNKTSEEIKLTAKKKTQVQSRHAKQKFGGKSYFPDKTSTAQLCAVLKRRTFPSKPQPHKQSSLHDHRKKYQVKK